MGIIYTRNESQKDREWRGPCPLQPIRGQRPLQPSWHARTYVYTWHVGISYIHTVTPPELPRELKGGTVTTKPPQCALYMKDKEAQPLHHFFSQVAEHAGTPHVRGVCACFGSAGPGRTRSACAGRMLSASIVSTSSDTPPARPGAASRPARAPPTTARASPSSIHRPSSSLRCTIRSRPIRLRPSL